MVTGSSGTVGTALVHKLYELNYKVIPLDIKRSVWDKRIDRSTLRLDLRKDITKLKVRTKPDIIIHLAAHARVHDLVVDPNRALENYIMTHNILEYARVNDIKRVVFASSREVYGETKSGRRKESSTSVNQILSPYTASKFGGEALVNSYYECYGIKPVIVRLSNVYGRFDVSERAVPLFIYYARRNRVINIFGAEKKLDFTYSDDAVDGLVRIIKRFDKVAPNTFNITRSEGAKIKDVAKIIIDYLGSKSELNISTKRTGEISVFTADISKAKNLLGFNPKTSVSEGIPKNIDWYLENIKRRDIYMIQRRDLLRRDWA